ncbi:hypothetical protein F383_35299 [Gossypium arboreum]|uniref:Uncharacterized protein n=1 Tax=Gossypium arboreum TaxID=29729 RepID=A0A0B0PPX4_GOSAR|nr:hypothetical protein F383_35299 [Gossypium arboreum]
MCSTMCRIVLGYVCSTKCRLLRVPDS